MVLNGRETDETPGVVAAKVPNCVRRVGPLRTHTDKPMNTDGSQLGMHHP